MTNEHEIFEGPRRQRNGVSDFGGVSSKVYGQLFASPVVQFCIPPGQHNPLSNRPLSPTLGALGTGHWQSASLWLFDFFACVA